MTRPAYTRRDALHVLGAGAASVLLPGCATTGRREPAASGDRPPNIIFIMTDDHCVQAMSCYGSRINTTPHIDRLAREGMRFENCFCTNAICAPSRAVILTGKHSHINGVTTNAHRFDGTQTTFPKLLQRIGYQTAMIGKWHLKSDPTGFDHWDVLIGQGPYYNPTMIHNGERRKHTGYTTDIITDQALAWLKNGRDTQRPFMLMCQHKAPHRNWQPGPDHLALYDDVDIPEPPTLFDDWAGRGSAATQQEMTVARHLSDFDLKFDPPGNLTPEQRAAWDAAYNPKNDAFREAHLSGRELIRWKYQRYVKDYLRCVASVDDNIGRLLDYLDRTGLARNTIVIYTSDQGWYLGEHGWYDKRWIYEESLRMPLLVRWPAVVRAGSVNHALCQNLDFAETLLDAASATIPADMQGCSLLPLLRGRSPQDWRQSIYYHYYEHPGAHNVHRHEGVRTERYKLIHFYRLDEWELYDLRKDPDEMRSVYADPAYADVVAKLKTELVRLRRRYQVTDAADREYDQLIESRRKGKG
ncbi:MAG: sulfatase [Phycisphaerales bacterium]|nr:sulfatase [Phycisphaerales bacterium]